MFLLTLTCTFSIFFFLFFFYTSLILSLVGLGDPSDFGPANRGSAFPVSGLPVREGPPSCHPVAHRWRTQTSQLRHQSSHTYARKIHINVRVFLNFFFFFPFTHLEPVGVFIVAVDVSSSYLPCHDCNFSCL